MDRLPKTIWTNSPQTEKERLKMTREVIGEGFYQRHGFVVLPELDRSANERVVVVYPRGLDYQEIAPANWEKKWKKVEKVFWRELEEVFINALDWYEEIEIRMTRYGTIASGDWLQEKGKRRVYYLRVDADIEDLAAMIINNLLYLEKDQLGITWSKREALMDFVMTRPRMKKIFLHYHPVMHQLSRVSVEVRKRSEEYLEELGLSSRERELELMGNKLVVLGKGVKGVLTGEEEKVLKYLVRREGELVTYDELADIKWGEGEFHTFWAINRQIGRIRNKLESVGVRRVKIESVRSRGYVLSG